MDIDVRDLDLGYTQCEGLNTKSKTTGEELLNKLLTNINSLKVHWIGEDATLHVNNLIRVYDSLGALLTDAILVTASAGDRIIAMQRVRSANGSGAMVGSELSKAAPNITTIAQAEPTERYFCDPAARNDYNDLVAICGEYEMFVNDFKTRADELMANWTSGADRPNALRLFNEFAENTDTYKKYLTDAKENLATAVSNLSQL